MTTTNEKRKNEISKYPTPALNRKVRSIWIQERVDHYWVLPAESTCL